ncbi:hypothetical protein ASG24_01280 [Methylophilus sp. Leaf414]|nr:hypothetical protein ASG24_01280 [Methylophilus sp. Leaf414]
MGVLPELIKCVLSPLKIDQRKLPKDSFLQLNFSQIILAEKEGFLSSFRYYLIINNLDGLKCVYA